MIDTENYEELLESEDEQDSAEPQSPIPLATTVDEAMPALRDLRARIVSLAGEKGDESSSEDQKVVLLEDPEDLAPKQAMLSTWAYALASLFDGHRSAAKVAKAFKRKFGQPVNAQQALELQVELDKAMLLLSDRFAETVKRQTSAYLANDTRPAAHAGSAYPAEPAALRETLAGFFSHPDGPGSLDDLTDKTIVPRDHVRAMILPHIDLRVGGPTYAYGYNALIRDCNAELFIILGVAHQCHGQGLFYVSQKDFDTPLGVVKTDRSMASRLRAATGMDPTVSEMAHKTEHSIEFQAVCLSTYLCKRFKRNVEIVPILCGGVDSFISENANPMDSPQFKKFAVALRAELEASKRPWCVLCSVDLSHVGPEFGHSTMITEHLLPPIERGDQRFLKPAAELNIRGVYAEILRTKGARNIDATMAVLLMLQTCRGLLKHGQLLHYDQMFKEGSHSAVSYASMMFE